MLAASLLAVLASTASCSWIAVKGPPPHAAPSPAPGCTTSGTPLTVDGTLAAVVGLPGLGGLAAAAGGCQNAACLAMIGGLVAAVPFLLSLDYGRRRVGHCREVDLTWRAQEHARELEREQAAAGRRGGPPPPAPGRLGVPCRPASLAGRCDPGLACVAERCVRAAPAPASAPASVPAAAPAPRAAH